MGARPDRLSSYLVAALAALGLAALTPAALAAPGDVHTSLARNIAPSGSSSVPDRLTVAGSTLFFAADAGAPYGRELWKTNAAGVTSMVRNIAPGVLSSNPEELTAVGSTLFFTADDGTGDRELWKSDGTPAGTVRVRNINRLPNADSNPNAASFPSELTEVGGRLFFAAQVGQQPDPTTSVQPADDRELYVSDGTASGTRLVGNLNNAGPSNPGSLTSYAGELYFRASNQAGSRLWRSDGTRAGTAPVSAFKMTPDSLTVAGDRLFFTGSVGTYGREPWVSDGTATGTKMLRNLATQAGAGSSPQSLTAVGSTLFFSAKVGTETELYKSDGTGAGTRLVRNLDPFWSSSPSSLVAYHGMLYFAASSPANGGTELYRSDGTFAGTRLVKDGLDVTSSSPAELTVVGDYLFFRAYTSFNAGLGTFNDQLIRSDGTTAGTVPVGGSGPGGDLGPGALTDFNGTLYYRDLALGSGMELWRATIEP
jgi:ELWxxDGT repeat protein